MNKIKTLWTLGLFFATSTMILYGQGKYLSNAGNIVFFSHTAIEDISAENSQVASVIDAANGELAIIVTMTQFQFEKKLMQEHFNENYVESEKYPKATFRGMITNNSGVDYAKQGDYDVRIEGEMTIHGVSKNINVEGSIQVTGLGGIVARTKFLLNPEDYNIKIPRVVRRNIAERLEITVDILHQPI